MIQARIFSPHWQVPKGNQCCMTKVTVFVAKFQNENQLSASISCSSRGLYRDGKGVLFTIDFYNDCLLGYDAKNLTNVLWIKINASKTTALAYNDGCFYIAVCTTIQWWSWNRSHRCRYSMLMNWIQYKRIRMDHWTFFWQLNTVEAIRSDTQLRLMSD